ncbi:MAG: TonB-dependent receptor [Cyclobacteriaceae bacterium]
MRIYLILFLNLVAFTGYGQSPVKFTGFVKDSIGNAVELANVVAIDQETGAYASFGVTDYLGRFVLKIEEGKTYSLKITFVGFEDYQENIKGRQNLSSPVTITLKPNLTELAALEIVDEFPVMISGDTISYLADAFTDGTERKLEDILEDLPGFEVDDEGGVRVQGKQVEKIMVEGKEFFDGDTKLATQNIPANAVDRVQVLRNQNDISPMNGLNDSDDRIALNITLEEGKKNMLFGDLEAGYGLDKRYFGHANLFYYNPKTTLNFIGDANNVGRQSFTANDYFRFTGGMRNMGQRSGSMMIVNQNDLGFTQLLNNTAAGMTNAMSAVNFNHTPNDTWKLTGFGIGAKSDYLLSTTSNRTYINTDNSTEHVEVTDHQINTNLLGKFGLTYTPSDQLHIGYEIFSKWAQQEGSEERITNNLGNQNDILSATDQRPTSVTHYLESFWAPDEVNVYSLEGSYEVTMADPTLSIQSDLSLFNSILPFGTMNQALTQSSNQSSHQQSAVFNWYHILNRTNHVNFNFGNQFTQQLLTSELHQPAGNQSLSNNVNYTLSDLYAGVRYRTKLGKVEFDPAVNLHRYSLTDWQESKSSTQTTLLLPQMGIAYEKSSHNIRLQYAASAAFADARRLASQIQIRNYNNVYIGNRGLNHSLYHTLDLTYMSFSMFSHYNFFAGLNYQRKYRDITSSVSYQGLERSSTPINVNAPNESLMIFGSGTKTFSNFKIDTRIRVMESSTTNMINDFENRNNSFTQQYDISVETRLWKTWTLETGYQITFNQYEGGSFANQFTNHQPFIETELNIGKWLSITADYNYNHYQSSTGSSRSTYDFLNAAIYFQKDQSPWQLSLKGNNLLNTNSIRRDNFSESLISTFDYFVLPRYFYVSLKYDI